MNNGREVLRRLEELERALIPAPPPPVLVTVYDDEDSIKAIKRARADPATAFVLRVIDTSKDHAPMPAAPAPDDVDELEREAARLEARRDTLKAKARKP